MANTLKFGNGEWAIKEGSALAYNDENGNFKPLPFDFTRASTATYVAEDGLIKTAAIGEPRIDFLDDSDGALLLEKQSTNFITYSEDFSNSYWTHNTDVTTTNSSELAPNGELDANLIEYVGSGYSFIRASLVAPSTVATLSVFAKKGNWRYLGFRNFQLSGEHSVFDFDTETFTNIEGLQTASFEALANGWYRIKVFQPSPQANPFVGFALANAIGGELDTTGGQVANVHLYGAQLEESYYPTSYIPTQGSTVTRVAERCNNGANEQVINSTEGVFYVEMNAFDNISRISLSDGSTSNRVSFRITDDNIDFQYRVGGSYSYRVDVDVDNSNTNKMAMSFNNGVFVGYLNGVAIGSPISGPSLSQGVLDRLNFNDGNSSDSFEGNIKEVKVYNTALTDQELQTLTTL